MNEWVFTLLLLVAVAIKAITIVFGGRGKSRD